jgi:hypothetical protein
MRELTGRLMSRLNERPEAPAREGTAPSVCYAKHFRITSRNESHYEPACSFFASGRFQYESKICNMIYFTFFQSPSFSARAIILLNASLSVM